MKISTMALLSALFALSGCGSDIDKYVDAYVSAWKVSPDRTGTEEQRRANGYVVCLSAKGR